MVLDPGTPRSLLDAVSEAHDLKEFLRTAVDYGVAALACDRGSAFLFEGATGSLHLRHHSRDPLCSVHLEEDQGVAGRGLSLARPHLFTGRELRDAYVSFGAEARLESLRAVAAFPVFHRGIPQAVFCFDFDAPGGGHPPPAAPGGSTIERFAHLSQELESPRFANAIHRVRCQQALLDIREAGEGPVRLRHSAAEFLTSFLAGFQKAGKKTPELAYLQLVDRRRATIRTFQGVGMPLSFQTSLSHGMESSDVQARVTQHGRPLLIVGEDEELFDKAVFDRFDHARFVRLWLPLFPFPTERLLQRTGKKVEALLSRILRWGLEKEDPSKFKRYAADWEPREEVHPPKRLVFATLEVGYLRADRGTLSPDPLTTDHATWCAAKAYELSEKLFQATLPGSLERIGAAVANLAYPRRLHFTMAMPSWREPEIRRYPASASWPAAIPEQAVMPPHPPDEPALFEPIAAKDKEGRGVPGGAEETRFNALIRNAGLAVRVALRLDDFAADLYTLIEEREEQPYFGTAAHDPRLPEIMNEVCREAGAERGLHLIFERRLSDNAAQEVERSWRLRGRPFAWPPEVEERETAPKEIELARSAAENRIPQYAFSGSSSKPHPVAAVPIELSAERQAVLMLHFPAGSTIGDDGAPELEARFARWVFRLSLRDMAVNDRFSRRMTQLRSDLAEARRKAGAGESGVQLKTFSQGFLGACVHRLGAVAGLLVITTEPETGPHTVERYWCIAGRPGEAPRFDCFPFVGAGKPQAALRAIESRDVLVLPPDDPKREELTEPVNQELIARQEALQANGEADRAQALALVVSFARGRFTRTTMVIVPAASQALQEKGERGALTLFLPGLHELSQVQESLLVELGRLAAETLAQLRHRDAAILRQELDAALGEIRECLARSESHDDVYGHLLRGVGGRIHSQTTGGKTRKITFWRLSEHAVVWLLSPGYRELVVRSGRGGWQEALAGQGVVPPHDHPLLSGEFGGFHPKKDRPILTRFRIWTFPVAATSGNRLLQSYAGLQGCRWLVSFPLMQADSKVIGVVDCLRASPLRPEEETVLTEMLRRLSQQTCFALAKCSFERVKAVARELTAAVGDKLDEFNPVAVYQILSEKVKTELEARHCDLFFENDGIMALHGTTRLSRCLTLEERNDYQVAAREGDEILGAAMHSGRARYRHAAVDCRESGHLSPALRKLFSEDAGKAQLVIPLKKSPNRRDEPVLGLLTVSGPFATVAQHDKTPLKKSGLLTHEHIERAQDLSVIVYRNLVTARLVERTEWLIGELQHSLGQRLQMVRFWCDDRLRHLRDIGGAPAMLKVLRERLDHAFGLVDETRASIRLYAKMRQPLALSERRELDLKRLIEDCCLLMQDQAQVKGCRIAYELREIPPIHGFEELLRSAVFNLLDNAIKYSYNGMEISAVLRESPDGRILISVENLGVGIPEGDREAVFKPYYRARVPDARGARTGSGIGLAIVKHAVEIAHGGKVKAESTPVKRIEPGKTAEEIAPHLHKTIFKVTLSRDKMGAEWNPSAP